MVAESKKGGLRERVGFVLVFILTAIATSSSVFIIFMPHGVGSWYWERGQVYDVFTWNLILVAITIILQLVVVRKPSPIVSAAPMLGLAFTETWWVLYYLQVGLPFHLLDHFYGAFLLSSLFMALLGVIGFIYSWKRIVGRNDFALSRKWFSILPFTCALGLSVAALLRGVKFYWMDEPFPSIPVAIFWAAVAAVVLAVFALRGRVHTTPRVRKALPRLLIISVIATPIAWAILTSLPNLILFALFWAQAMFILQFAVASANMDWLIHLPWGRSAVKIALVEGFLALVLWMLLILAVFPDVFVY